MLSFNRKELLNAVKSAAKILPRKTFQPILNCIRITSSEVVGTNLDAWLTVKVTSSIASNDVFVIPAKMLIELLLNHSAETITIENGVVSGIKIEMLNVDDFPTVQAFIDRGSVASITEGALLRVLEQTLFTLIPDSSDLRSLLFLDGNKAIATDGVRLSIVDFGSSLGIEALFPVDPLRALKALLKVSQEPVVIETNGEFGEISASSFSLLMRLGLAGYIDYQKLLPTENGDTRIEIQSRKGLLSALKLLKSGLDEKVNIVSICPDGTVSNGTDYVPAPIDASGLSEAFPCDYTFLVQALDSLSAETLSVGVHGHYLHFLDGNYQHLLCGFEK